MGWDKGICGKLGEAGVGVLLFGWGVVGEVFTFKRVFLAWDGEEGGLGFLKEEGLRSRPFKISSIFLKGQKNI